jgi:HK97 family phage major capsid protein
MAYNSIIDRTGVASLIPQENIDELMLDIVDSSWLLNMAKRLPNMNTAQVRMPVLSSLATAEFVNGDTGLKQTTDIAWESKYINAEEIAAIVPIPDSVRDDTPYDIFGAVKSQLVTEFNRVINKAVLYGTGIPATWTTNLGAAGIVAHATAAGHTASLASFTDIYEAIFGESSEGAADGVYSRLEHDGFSPSGNVMYSSMKTKLRGCRSTDGVPLFNADPSRPATYMLDGVPAYVPNDGTIDGSSSLMISGDWQRLVYSVRQDMTFKILTEGVITDASNNIVYNLPQQDMIAIRAVMRIGFALPNPINRMEETEADRSPFSILTA